ncbi:hypothetical protein, partial [Nocardia neocaledoniensis]|uniref:hypothetical protein n=1 Tax=Nocardia neocaledoniensis TaxID=236511 RepID=UPI0024573597
MATPLRGLGVPGGQFLEPGGDFGLRGLEFPLGAQVRLQRGQIRVDTVEIAQCLASLDRQAP